MLLQGILLLGIAILGFTQATNVCPADFLRLTDHHSYCLPPNEECQMVNSGVSEADKKIILDTHNKLRNTVALGEDNKEGLPTASNMLQMTWDNTLASIAQAYAYQCHYKHDCDECRSVDDYMVGQNLGEWPWNCGTENCAGAIDNIAKIGNWTPVIQKFYDERVYIDPSLVENHVFGHDYGHFTQLAWAETWKIGCGYSAYLSGEKSLKHLYVCNYGIAGNGNDVPIWKTGQPCSECPENSCCGSQCGGSDSYDGLCKLDDPKKAPIWKDADKGKDIIFDCKFDDNCVFGITGKTDWMVYNRVYGETPLVVLNGGETTTMNFFNPIQPNGKFCLAFILRKGPNEAGQEDNNSLETVINMGQYDPWKASVAKGVHSVLYGRYVFNLFDEPTTFTLTFSVPEGAPPQYLEIQRIYAYNGKC